MRPVFTTAVKLLGITLAIRAVSSLAGLAMSSGVSIGGTVSTHLSALPWTLCIHAAVSLVLSFILMAYAEGIAIRLRIPDSNALRSLTSPQIMMLGIQLMGIWLLVNGFVDILQHITRLLSTQSVASLYVWVIVSKAVEAIIGFWMASSPWTFGGVFRIRAA